MFFTPFCACLVLLLTTLFFDLRTSRLLRHGIQTRETKALRAFWPLQVFLHVILLYIIASVPLLHKEAVTKIHTSSRVAPGPLVPSLPPSSLTWKKSRVEHL